MLFVSKLKVSKACRRGEWW